MQGDYTSLAFKRNTHRKMTLGKSLPIQLLAKDRSFTAGLIYISSDFLLMFLSLARPQVFPQDYLITVQQRERDSLEALLGGGHYVLSKILSSLSYRRCFLAVRPLRFIQDVRGLWSSFRFKLRSQAIRQHSLCYATTPERPKRRKAPRRIS